MCLTSIIGERGVLWIVRTNSGFQLHRASYALAWVSKKGSAAHSNLDCGTIWFRSVPLTGPRVWPKKWMDTPNKLKAILKHWRRPPEKWTVFQLPMDWFEGIQESICFWPSKIGKFPLNHFAQLSMADPPPVTGAWFGSGPAPGSPCDATGRPLDMPVLILSQNMLQVSLPWNQWYRCMGKATRYGTRRISGLNQHVFHWRIALNWGV